MDEARASWNTVYQSQEGFECQVTLRDEDEVTLEERVQVMMEAIVKSGGTPLKRRSFSPNGNGNGNGHGHTNGNGTNGDTQKKPEKTFVDAEGVRRCNLKLKDGKVCGSPVHEREGKFGPFWSCPNYREHAA